jgi:opacity protein-like surface antigen
MPSARPLVLIVALGLLASAPNAVAQSRQPWSVQGSVLYTAQDLGGEAGTVGGIGFEAQARRTFPRFSFGAGVQYSRHTSGPDALGLTGIFVEPRFVPNATMGPFAPYLAGRIVYLRGSLESDLIDGSGSSSGLAFGVGAGLIYPLTRRINFDVGGAVLRQSLGNITLDDANETEVEFPSFFGYVVKAGVSIGFESSASSALRRLWH